MKTARHRIGLTALLMLVWLPLSCSKLYAPRPLPPPAPAPTPTAPAEPVAKPAAPVIPTSPTEVADRREVVPGLTLARLTNGLTILVEEDHASPVCTVRFYVKNTGSVFEDRYLGAGLSHVLEHLVSGGTTTNRTGAQFEELTDAMGGDTNAYTSSNLTAYHITAASRHAGQCIDLLSDMMQNCVFDRKEYRREMKVVQRELTMGKASRGNELWAMNARNLYGDHPAAMPTIGFRNVLARVSRDQIVAYYKDRYVPNNLTLVVAGDVDTEKVIERVRQAFLNTPRRNGEPIVLPPVQPISGPRQAYKEMDGKLTDLRLSFPTIPLLHEDLYALDVMDYILSGGDSARLNVAIKEQKQLVLSIGSYSWTPSFVAGSLTVWAELEPENLGMAVEAVLVEVEKLREELVDPGELAKAKKQMVAAQVLNRQEVEDRAEELAFDWIGTGNPQFSRQYVERIQQVTAEQIRDVARKYIDRSRLCTAAIVPRGKLPRAAGAAAVAKKPEIRKVVLPNGLTALLKHNPAVPLVAVEAYYNAGVLVETDANNGIGTLTGQMLMKGAAGRTAQQIADYFDSIGAAVSTAGGRNTGYLAAEVLKQDFEPALARMAELLLEPTFPEDELKKLKTLTTAAIKNREADLDNELHDLVLQNLPRTTPYRRQTMGTLKSVEAIQRDDLAAFHKTYCVPNNTVLAVYGDVPLDTAEAAVRRLFSDWKPNPQLKLPSYTKPFRVKQAPPIVKFTGKPSAGIQMAFPTTSFYDYQDNAALSVLLAVMAGYYMPGGWLHEELRGQGLVYTVHAYNTASRAPGMATFYAQCEPDKVEEVVRRIEANIAKAADGRITRAEFEKAKQRVIAYKELQDQTNSAQATRDALNVLFGTGLEHHERVMRLVREVRLTDVKRVARQYLRDHLVCITRPKPAAQTQP